MKFKFEKDITESCKRDVKKNWNYVRKLNSMSGIKILNLGGSKNARSDQDKAEALNTFYESTFTKEDVSSIPTFQNTFKTVVIDGINITKE